MTISETRHTECVRKSMTYLDEKIPNHGIQEYEIGNYLFDHGYLRFREAIKHLVKASQQGKIGGRPTTFLYELLTNTQKKKVVEEPVAPIHQHYSEDEFGPLCSNNQFVEIDDGQFIEGWKKLNDSRKKYYYYNITMKQPYLEEQLRQPPFTMYLDDDSFLQEKWSVQTVRDIVNTIRRDSFIDRIRSENAESNSR